MAVMPEGRDTEEPDAGHGKEQAAEEPHADIVARLLEYRRRLREEIGGEPASFEEDSMRRPPPMSKTSQQSRLRCPRRFDRSGRRDPNPNPRREHPTRRARNRRTPVSSRSGSTASTRPWLGSLRCSHCSEGETTTIRILTTRRTLRIHSRRGGSSVGQSSGLIIRRSQVQVLPAPPDLAPPDLVGLGAPHVPRSPILGGFGWFLTPCSWIVDGGFGGVACQRPSRRAARRAGGARLMLEQAVSRSVAGDDSRRAGRLRTPFVCEEDRRCEPCTPGCREADHERGEVGLYTRPPLPASGGLPCAKPPAQCGPPLEERLDDVEDEITLADVAVHEAVQVDGSTGAGVETGPARDRAHTILRVVERRLDGDRAILEERRVDALPRPLIRTDPGAVARSFPTTVVSVPS